ncbi:MAG: helix-turn-helix domain-containing protein [Jiangellaceae bacterium]
MARGLTSRSDSADPVGAHEAGELLRVARRRRGLSQRALAAAAGVSHTVVARVESGKSQPTLPTLKKLLAGAGFSPAIQLVNTARPSELLRRNKQAILELAHRYGVLSIKAFGSVAAGTDGPDSDLDLLVEFADDVGGFERVDFAEALEELLGVEVDMVNPSTASAEFKASIQNDLRRLEDF